MTRRVETIDATMLVLLVTSVLMGYFRALCIWKDPHSLKTSGFAKAVVVFLAVGLLSPMTSMMSGRQTTTPLAAPLWSFSLNRRHCRPVADGGLVYALATDYPDLGHIYAFDGASGHKLWDRSTNMTGRRRFKGKLSTTPDPLAGGGQLYYLTPDEQIHALEGSTGNELWQYGPVLSLLAATVHTVFLLNTDGQLILLDRQGHVIRRTHVEGTECSDLSGEGAVMVLSCSATQPVEAFDVKTGRLLWSSEKYQGLLEVASGMVYHLSGETITGLEAATGKERWTYAIH
ncbi:MAG: PQQ-like beta-propeller repeat protein, partial [Acidobacteria bacterium]|nr:PQQ-like beta-propeller repeat protein [Acidobacteriota bacterium]